MIPVFETDRMVVQGMIWSTDPLNVYSALCTRSCMYLLLHRRSDSPLETMSYHGHSAADLWINTTRNYKNLADMEQATLAIVQELNGYVFNLLAFKKMVVKNSWFSRGIYIKEKEGNFPKFDFAFTLPGKDAGEKVMQFYRNTQHRVRL